MYFINLLQPCRQQDILVIYSITNTTQKQTKRTTGFYLSWKTSSGNLNKGKKTEVCAIRPDIIHSMAFWRINVCDGCSVWVSEWPLPHILPAHTHCKGLCRSNGCRRAPFSSWTPRLRSPLTDSTADISPRLSKKHNTERAKKSCVGFQLGLTGSCLLCMHNRI